MLVSVEGIDGSGKSTVIDALSKSLESSGRTVFVTREPTGSWLGRAVRQGIATDLEPAALLNLFMADRAQHVRLFEPRLAAGDVVLTDRYADSTIAYQSVALADTRPDVFTWLWDLNWARFPAPDLTLYLDIEPAEGLRRIAGRSVKEPFERIDFLTRVHQAYAAIASRAGARWQPIDASATEAEVARRAVRALDAMPSTHG